MENTQTVSKSLFSLMLVPFIFMWAHIFRPSLMWLYTASIESETTRVYYWACSAYTYVQSHVPGVWDSFLRFCHRIYQKVIGAYVYIMTFAITKFKKGRPYPAKFSIGEQVEFKDDKYRMRKGIIKVIRPEGRDEAYIVETPRGKRYLVEEISIIA